ncbi:MAG: hypothetical protein Q4G69_13650 [Planctomycetia bacterium]|nr:hypothetical protein [Planctomycetia bacterium]
MKYQIPLFFLFLLLVCAIGCGGPERPAGFPDIYPCEVRLTQEKQPLANASILLKSDLPDLDRWAIAGITDANGVAVLTTNGKFPGAPEGDFIVCVSKEEIEYGPEKMVQGEMVKTNPKKFLCVEKIYSDSKTSPLKIKIEKKKNHFDFDAGKKIRTEVKMIQ